MASPLNRFEQIARAAKHFSDKESLAAQETVYEAVSEQQLHPFDKRNISPRLPANTRKLFDNGHYAEATFEAFKFVENEVKRHAQNQESGRKLMMAVFDPKNPEIKLTPLSNTSEVDEQEGFRFIFAGGSMAIRNPRGHDNDPNDDVDVCLDHLAFASLLLRRLEQAGYL